MIIINAESGQLTRVPRAPQTRGTPPAATRAAVAAASAAVRHSCSRRDARTLYFRSGTASALYRRDHQPAGQSERRRRRAAAPDAAARAD